MIFAFKVGFVNADLRAIIKCLTIFIKIFWWDLLMKQVLQNLNSGETNDIVVPVPDSGNAAALGYAEEKGLKFDLGLIRNHYVGRTFIEPSQQIRSLGAVSYTHLTLPTSDLV